MRWSWARTRDTARTAARCSTRSRAATAAARASRSCRSTSAARELAALKAKGIVGIAFNSTLDGVEYYLGAHDLLARLADLDMILQIQAEKDQLAAFHPLLEKSRVRIGDRPLRAARTSAPAWTQPGFQALLDLGRSGPRLREAVGLRQFTPAASCTRTCGRSCEALLDALHDRRLRVGIRLAVREGDRSASTTGRC